jgi:hypothetical protein
MTSKFLPTVYKAVSVPHVRSDYSDERKEQSLVSLASMEREQQLEVIPSQAEAYCARGVGVPVDNCHVPGAHVGETTMCTYDKETGKTTTWWQLYNNPDGEAAKTLYDSGILKEVSLYTVDEFVPPGSLPTKSADEAEKQRLYPARSTLIAMALTGEGARGPQTAIEVCQQTTNSPSVYDTFTSRACKHAKDGKPLSVVIHDSVKQAKCKCYLNTMAGMQTVFEQKGPLAEAVSQALNPPAPAPLAAMPAMPSVSAPVLPPASKPAAPEPQPTTATAPMDTSESNAPPAPAKKTPFEYLKSGSPLGMHYNVIQQALNDPSEKGDRLLTHAMICLHEKLSGMDKEVMSNGLKLTPSKMYDLAKQMGGKEFSKKLQEHIDYKPEPVSTAASSFDTDPETLKMFQQWNAAHNKNLELAKKTTAVPATKDDFKLTTAAGASSVPSINDDLDGSSQQLRNMTAALIDYCQAYEEDIRGDCDLIKEKLGISVAPFANRVMVPAHFGVQANRNMPKEFLSAPQDGDRTLRMLAHCNVPQKPIRAKLLRPMDASVMQGLPIEHAQQL